MNVNYVIIFVSDMARSVAFYRDVLGLNLKYETPEWSEFATTGATLALHRGDALSDPDGLGPTAAGQCRPGLSVPDLDAFHQRLCDRGVTVVEAPRESFGVRIAQYRDPDGLGLSVSEAPRERGR